MLVKSESIRPHTSSDGNVKLNNSYRKIVHLMIKIDSAVSDLSVNAYWYTGKEKELFFLRCKIKISIRTRTSQGRQGTNIFRLQEFQK
jgi:hypothetical protein